MELTSKLFIDRKKKVIAFSPLALESMDMDAEKNKFIIFSTMKTEEKGTNTALYIVNIANSEIEKSLNDNKNAYDDEYIPKDKIYVVEKNTDDGAVGGRSIVNDRFITLMDKFFKNADEVKLVPQENVVGQMKELVESYDIKCTCHKLIKASSKINFIGKSSEKQIEEEKIKID